MKTHFKKLRDPNYFGAHSILDGEHTELTVTIKQVAPGQVKTERGTEDVTLLHLVDHKPLILNATNGEQISKTLDTPFVEDWSGKRITLYVKRIKAYGDWVDAVRVKPSVPKDTREVMDTKHPKFKAAQDNIKSGAVTLQQIETKYKLSDDARKKL